MQKRGIDYSVYIQSLSQSWGILTKHPIIYLPDTLLLLSTAFSLWAFLTFNELYAPLLHTIQTKQTQTLATTLRSIIQTTPTLLKLALSALLTLAFNLSLGITFLTTRYLLIKGFLGKEQLSFSKAFKASTPYFISVFLTKLLLFILYLLPVVFFFLILASTTIPTKTMLPYTLTGLLILWFLIRFFTFYTYPLLYLETNSIKALPQAVSYSKRHSKHILIVMVILAFVSFFLSILLSLLPQAWITLAFSAKLLSYTGLFSTLYFFLTRIVNLIHTVFETSFIMASYELKK